VTEFRPVYDWFKSSLVLLAPDSNVHQFERFFEEANPFHGAMNTALTQLDTGVARLGAEEVPLESLPIDESLVNVARAVMKTGGVYRINVKDTNERFLITREGDDLIARKLVSFHKRSDGSDVQFELRQESSGSQRLIDLLPVFIDLSSQEKSRVYVIDELDRSMHTLLTRQLLEDFIDSRTSMSRSQLVFTTHDVLLMDQELLRRDEMWVAERDAQGQSQLFSFAEYKELRNDTDIRKRYLQGRLGGTPQILLSGALTPAMAFVQSNDEA
jgi:hypothetical protein